MSYRPKTPRPYRRAFSWGSSRPWTSGNWSRPWSPCRQLTSQVVGNLAHGVNNALTKLIGYVELLSDEGLGETERRELLQMAAVDEEAVYAARQLLGFARRLRAT